jgi:hypothetical protein
MFGAPERLSVFGARTFSTVITTSVVQDLNEKIVGVDFPLRCTYRIREVSVFLAYVLSPQVCKLGT